MTAKSKIEWTEQTWNPVTGCTKISAGCKHCYAETMAKRLQAMNVKGYENGFNLSILPERLLEPLKRKKPTIYFVNSMSDLFHENIDENFIEQVFSIIQEATQHQFQILTKRADRLALFFKNRVVPNNAWLGVTVENKEHGLMRIDYLRKIDAKIRFLSCEPLLEDLGNINLKDIHWVIVGGESGTNARPMAIEWAENVQQQCQNQKVKFFFKQWGGWGADGKKRPKKENGRILNGRIFNEMPLDEVMQ
ncbi:MAG: phage Gp37/Gp68 family protein [Methylococcales bacterium]|nr:phage Gp37/Gp68 family protein [Methylococcales bacterium]MDD5754512.1 phage Gp37/Gp68 family protein [Methylococcales bacterium]